LRNHPLEIVDFQDCNPEIAVTAAHPGPALSDTLILVAEAGIASRPPG
jgi:hypothetical protein